MQARINDVPVCADARAGSDGNGDGALAFLRSLRASRNRRAAFALHRRRTLRGRRSVLAMAAGLFVLSAGAVAQQAAPGPSPAPAADMIAAAQRALGVAADGVVGAQTRGAVKRFQRSSGLTVDGIIGPQTLKALGVRPGAPEAQAASVESVLARIAQCESGGNPTAVSASGRYRGKYQFSRATWRRMGGTGDPAAAPEADQDALAAKLFAEAGTSPWPNCA